MQNNNSRIRLFFLSGIVILSYFASYCTDIDTINPYPIEGIILKAERTYFFAEDRKIAKLDSFVLAHSKGANVGEVLSVLPVMVKQYGVSGSVTNLAIRGAQANHTLISWNGIPINSHTHGSGDLSLIPCGFSDEILLNYGAAGTLYGSGTFGGALDLNNKFTGSKINNGNVLYENGSYGSHKLYSNVKLSGLKVQYSVAFLHHRARNDFKYEDEYAYGTPEIIADNNQLRSTGIVQHINVRLSEKQFLKTGLWYQQKYKEIPGTMGASESRAFQRDSTIKAYIAYSLNNTKSTLVIKSGLTYDYLYYRNDSLVSVFDIKNSYNEVNYKIRVSDKITTYHSLIAQFVKADVLKYSGIKKEKEFAVVSGVKYENRQMITNVQVRVEKTDERSPRVLFAVGSRLGITSKLSASGNFSTKYRTPTFNERYWEPGGNPDIEPEKGWTGEASLMYQSIIGTMQGSAYYTRIEDLVQWVSNPILQPVSEKNVRIFGFEFDNRKLIELNKNSHLLLNTSYAFTKTKILDVYSESTQKTGNELIYVPNHLVAMNLQFQQNDFFGTLEYHYTSKRYTDEDNNEFFALNGYSLLDFKVGYSYTRYLVRPEIVFKLNNILNTDYQVQRSYPMPGRNYSVSFILHFN